MKNKSSDRDERRDHRDKEKISAEDPNGGGGDIGPNTTVQYSDRDAAVGHELIGQYYMVLYNVPENV